MIVVGTLVVALAAFVTVHVAIAYGLVWRRPRWHALAGFFVLPLAPYWAWREHMRVRTGIWGGALVLYIVAAIVARF